MHSIDSKIVGYRIADKAPEAMPRGAPDNILQVHEKLERPQTLLGSTYKIKTPVSAHAMYITINDIVLNEGTEHELRRPFEIFVNSKNMENFQWVVALTRLISAVFRKGGDATFLVEELKAVFAPTGGYFKKGNRFMPSEVAEIGCVIETHMQNIGMLSRPEPAAAERQAEPGIPGNAGLCAKCHTRAMVQRDGCMTCLSCGESKCG